MDTIFTEVENNAVSAIAPLAVRMRPVTIDELVGQAEVVGEGTWLRGAIENDELSSIILYGPAGTGKTTLARIIANQTSAHFAEVSAITGGVGDLRRVIDEARSRLSLNNMRTILFIDEIHRFSRSQQDALLHAVEDRVLVLVGATTENPFFEVNSALISRSRVVEFKALADEDIAKLLMRALSDERGLKGGYTLDKDASEAIVTMSGGDARSALTTLELAADVATLKAKLKSSATGAQAVLSNNLVTGDLVVKSQGTDKLDPKVEAQDGLNGKAIKTNNLDGKTQATTGVFLDIKKEHVLEATPRRTLLYDKKGDAHYDVISAFIKSMRGSDPDAAVYYLARMLECGEDPKFIARRIYIFASEDIGNADPQALLIASAAFKAVEVIGLPECQLNLSQAVLYMALAPKSNSATNAIFAARAEVANGPARDVPNALRDRHRPGSDKYGKYHYPHLDARGYVEQQYLPDGLERGAFFKAGERGWEAYRTEATLRDKISESL
ncbi:MAG: replication-associated recombination protein A [Coriobacteriales bacterium]|jgi:putative ATPase|nr:replication-associated recombination protein A [Coriobacteriales bacterium]